MGKVLFSNPTGGNFLTKFILFFVTLDLSDTLTEMRIVKNPNVILRFYTISKPPLFSFSILAFELLLPKYETYDWRLCFHRCLSLNGAGGRRYPVSGPRSFPVEGITLVLSQVLWGEGEVPQLRQGISPPQDRGIPAHTHTHRRECLLCHGR